MTSEMPQEKTMNDNDDVILTPEQNERLHMAIQRVRANFLRFPVLCTNVTCRRARKCSADPDFCMGQLAPDVPDDVRNAADEMLFGTFAGLPFDEMAAKATPTLRLLRLAREGQKPGSRRQTIGYDRQGNAGQP